MKITKKSFWPKKINYNIHEYLRAWWTVQLLDTGWNAFGEAVTCVWLVSNSKESSLVYENFDAE